MVRSMIKDGTEIGYANKQALSAVAGWCLERRLKQAHNLRRSTPSHLPKAAFSSTDDCGE
jgi:hypothetical protein